MTAINAIRRPDGAAEPTLALILRVGVACCFIGHGSLGLLRTAAWTSYFGVVGIGPHLALELMPWVGAFDVLMAVSVLFVPLRWVVFYMTGWALWTALLRPLAGEPFWEAVERAGNYGAPLALFLVLAPSGSLRSWLGDRFGERAQARALHWVLRLTTVLLLLGHGLLNWVVQKHLFVVQYNLIGLSGATVEPWVGAFECLLALAVLFKPDYRLLLGVVIWKLATEVLNPMAGSPIWVFIEHGGSYAAPLALAFLMAPFRFAPVSGRPVAG